MRRRFFYVWTVEDLRYLSRSEARDAAKTLAKHRHKPVPIGKIKVENKPVTAGTVKP